MDTMLPEARHNNMSHIKSVLKPEVLLRSRLFALWLRFRKNDKKLPGSPDIVFPKFKAVVFARPEEYLCPPGTGLEGRGGVGMLNHWK